MVSSNRELVENIVRSSIAKGIARKTGDVAGTLETLEVRNVVGCRSTAGEMHTVRIAPTSSTGTTMRLERNNIVITLVVGNP